MILIGDRHLRWPASSGRWRPTKDVLARMIRKTLYIGVFAFIIGNSTTTSPRSSTIPSRASASEASGGTISAGAAASARENRSGRRHRRPAHSHLDFRASWASPASSTISSRSSSCWSAWAIHRHRELLRHGDPALRQPDRIQADDAGRASSSCPSASSAAPGDSWRRRCSATCRLVGRRDPRPRGDRRHRLDDLQSVHKRLRRNPPTINDAPDRLILAALTLLGLTIFGPGIANGLIAGGPSARRPAPADLEDRPRGRRRRLRRLRAWRRRGIGAAGNTALIGRDERVVGASVLGLALRQPFGRRMLGAALQAAEADSDGRRGSASSGRVRALGETLRQQRFRPRRECSQAHSASSAPSQVEIRRQPPRVGPARA